MPDLVVIAGPNGAGKSTSQPILIRERLGVREFVNADVIAADLAPQAPEGVAVEAGRIMINRLGELAKAGESFSFETTLASRSFAPWIAKLKRERGYRFHLFFLWLPEPEDSVRRVARRVERGGHHIPTDVIHRRHPRGLVNLRELYSPIADSWRLYENSSEARLLEKGGEEAVMGISDKEVLTNLHEGAREARRLHKAAGVPIVIRREGKRVEVPAEEIEV